MRFILKLTLKISCLFIVFFSFADADATVDGFNAKIESIPLAIQQKIIGTTWHLNCPVPLSDLSYLTLSYWGFDHKIHQGILIANKQLTPSVIIIFQQLFIQHFPIEQMRPMYLFHGDDEKSMAANNTSAFNCRIMKGSDHKFSLHAYGKAIDINPKLNPYVKGTTVAPKNSGVYVNRTVIYPGMIAKNTPIYNDFITHGWEWGGDWHSLKDYQHFQQDLR